MIEIHFYKETELKYSVYANSLEDVIKAPADYYAEYTVDMVITDVKFLNPIYINGELREMTREEQLFAGLEISLEEGEIIKRKKIIKIEKPSQWHTWTGKEWEVDLEAVKASKREELKAVRTAKIQANIEVHGEVFQVRDSDKENFDDTGLMIRTGEIDYSYVKNWILADNSVKPFTAQQIIDVWKERTKRKDKIFLEFGQLSMQLKACQTVEEIEAIKWE